jgi:hypothetical protein
MSMKPELSSAVPPRRWNAALVILVAAVSLGTQPALSGDAVQDVQSSAIAGRVRPLDVVKSSVSKVLAAVQSQTAAGSESAHWRRVGPSPVGDRRRCRGVPVSSGPPARLTAPR